MMRYLIVGLILLLSLKNSYAQNKWPEFKGKMSFRTYVEQMLNSDLRITNNGCDLFVIVAKFSVDQNGFIDSVEFLDDSGMYFKLLVRDAIETTHGTWEPATQVDTKVSHPLILPVYFKLEAGCKLRENPKGEEISVTEILGFDPDNLTESSGVRVFQPIYVFGERGFLDIGGNK